MDVKRIGLRSSSFVGRIKEYNDSSAQPLGERQEENNVRITDKIENGKRTFFFFLIKCFFSLKNLTLHFNRIIKPL